MNENMKLTQEGRTDAQFLHMLARRTGMQCAAIHGEINFMRMTANKTPIITLEYGKTLLSFKKRISLRNQVGKVKITSVDAKGQRIDAEVSSTTLSGSKSASSLDAAVKAAEIEEVDFLSVSKEELKKLAQNIYDGMALGFLSGSGECIGIPELIPGRYISIAGVDSEDNGEYFITEVKHIFSENGYKTTFSFKGAKT
jgi:phage protein D